MNHQNKTAAEAKKNQAKPGISKLELEMPVMLNKIILTEKIMFQLDLLQMGGGTHLTKPEYNNDDIVTAKEYLTKTILYLIEQIADKGPGEQRKEEDELIFALRWLYSVFEDFEVPKHLLY